MKRSTMLIPCAGITVGTVALALRLTVGDVSWLSLLAMFVEWVVMVAALSALAASLVMFRLVRAGKGLLRGLRAHVSDNRAQLTTVFVGLSLYVPFHAACGVVKQRLNETHPFWADPFLANWDSSLFGRDPGEALHRLLGQNILAILDFGYSLWFPVNAMCFIACLYYGRARLLLTYFLLWGVCGPLGQVIASSAGPMFWPLLGYGNRFDQMIAGLSFGPIYGAKYLWLTYTDESMRFGAGIAAVPSLHVAGAVWVAINTYRTRLYVFGLSYLFCVSIGSVALGWHYAVDGIIGAGCTFLMLAVACLYPFGKTNDTAPDSVTLRDDLITTANQQ